MQGRNWSGRTAGGGVAISIHKSIGSVAHSNSMRFRQELDRYVMTIKTIQSIGR